MSPAMTQAAAQSSPRPSPAGLVLGERVEATASLAVERHAGHRGGEGLVAFKVAGLLDEPTAGADESAVLAAALPFVAAHSGQPYRAAIVWTAKASTRQDASAITT